MAKMLRDLAERGLDKGLYGSLVTYAGESFALTPENPNVVRVIHSVLKGFQGLYQTPYFKEEILGNLVLKYLDSLEKKVGLQVQALGKENIDALTQTVTAA